ncbi:MAG: hypothetical protein OER88_12075, partial [Planctomycetota bacterium]|nr:hypothetical protein [Planctomycetota bacterium]
MRRFWRYLWRGLLVLAILLGLAYVFREPLFGDWVRTKIAAALGDAVGGRWSVHKTEGSWYGDFAVVGLSLEEPPPTGPLAELRCARAAAEYSLLGLLGDDPVAGIQRIEISGADVVVDLTRPPTPPEPEPEEPPDPWELMPESFPEIVVRGRVTVRRAGAETVVGALALDVKEQALALALKELVETELPDLHELTIGVTRTGPRQLDVTITDAVFGVTLESARAVFGEGGAFDANAVLNVGGGTVTVATDGRNAEAIVRDVDLSQVERLPEPVKGFVDGTVRVTDATVIEAQLNARDIEARDQKIDGISAVVRWDGETLRIPTLDAVAGAERVEASGLLIEMERPYYLAAVDRIDILIADVKKYWPDAPASARVTAKVRSEDGRNVTVETIEIVSGGTKLLLRGDAQLPEDPEAWQATTLDLVANGTLVGLRRFSADVPRIDGPLTLRATVAGSVGEPRASLTVRGTALAIEGRRVSEVSLTGDLTWPELSGLEVRLVSEAGRVDVSGRANIETQTLHEGAYT